jgi:hypothetical protein
LLERGRGLGWKRRPVVLDCLVDQFGELPGIPIGRIVCFVEMGANDVDGTDPLIPEYAVECAFEFAARGDAVRCVVRWVT